MRSSLIRLAFSAAVSVAMMLTGVVPAQPAAAALGKITGKVVDSVTLAPLAGVCVYIGIPGNICFTEYKTQADGTFVIDLDNGPIRPSPNPGTQYAIYFKHPGYVTNWTPNFVLNSNGTGYTFGQDPNVIPANWKMVKEKIGPRASCADPGTGNPNPPALTTTVYLPNVTRRLGGPDGWYTPFIIQNTGTVPTTLEVTFYMFTTGACVSRYLVSLLQPGTSHANNPNDNAQNPLLPNDAQFSVVVQSFGSQVVGIVNEHAGTGARAEALSYNGFNAGAKTVYLPNITRRFFGLFVTPFIIQNLGTGSASVNATFRTFDGTGTPVSIFRFIEPGRSKPIDPNSNDGALGAPGLVDGKQYSVTVTSNQDIAVVVNTHADAPGVAQPLAYATDGVTAGAATIYGAYAAKNAQGVGRYSTIVVQNLGAAAVTPKITFTPLTGAAGTANTYTFAAPIQPNSSKAFDPRFSFSTQGTSNTPCSTGGTDCLADGEYAIKIEPATATTGASLAAQINVFTASTGMGYAATATPAAKFFLPNVTKSLCFCPSPTPTSGWTTPILLQSVTATSATVRWYNFVGGALAHTETVSLTPGGGIRIDPWGRTQLLPDRQYSVVVDAGSGTVTAIVTEFASGGDNAMIYEGFASP